MRTQTLTPFQKSLANRVAPKLPANPTPAQEMLLKRAQQARRMPPLRPIIFGGWLEHSIPSYVYSDQYDGNIRYLRKKYPSDSERIKQAALFAWQAHFHEKRKSGEPYAHHPAEVARLAAENGLSADEAITALLHDAVENGRLLGQKVTKELIGEKFGEHLQLLVDGVTTLGKEPEYDRKQGPPPERERLLKMLTIGGKDIGTIRVKLMDRLHNMRTLEHMPEAKRLKIAQETLNVFAPFANALGMSAVKRELEDLSFRHLEPKTAQAVNSQVEVVRKESGMKVAAIARRLRKNISREFGTKAEVFIEPRTAYEIFRKQTISSRDRDLKPADLWRVQVILPGRANCYKGLGVVHRSGLGVPLIGEMLDRVAIPRPNGHQFIRTYLDLAGEIGALEVEIRNRQMWRQYQVGIERLKIGSPGVSRLVSQDWLNALIEALRTDAAVDMTEVYKTINAVSAPIVVRAQKPGGSVRFIELQRGATPLDLARKVHTDIFLRAKTAWVNGRSVPLDTVLKQGDAVYIETAEEPQATADWLNMCVAERTKVSLRRHLSEQAESKGPGWIYESAVTSLDRQAIRHFLSIRELIKLEIFKDFVLTREQCNTIGDFMYKVGLAQVNASKLIADFIEYFARRAHELEAQGEVWHHPIMAVVKDRAGWLEDVTRPIRNFNRTIIRVGSYSFQEDGLDKATILLVIKGVTGEIGQIQQLQIKTILQITRGTEAVNEPTLDEMRNLAEHLWEDPLGLGAGSGTEGHKTFGQKVWETIRRKMINRLT